MRCQACDYELWHCVGRTCPECGTEFSLDDYIFEKDTVLFYCPHCNQGIAGEQPTGRPPETTTECEGCGKEVGIYSFIVRPTEEYEEALTTELLPIRTSDGNWFTRYFETVWLVMTKPTTAIRKVPPHEPLVHAWKFYFTTLLFTTLVGMIPSILLFPPNVFGMGGGVGINSVTYFMVIQLVVGVGASILFVLLWILMTHVQLQIAGGSTFTMRRTTQAILYGYGATIVSIIPCIGGFFGLVWWTVSAINMIARGQRVSGGRASIAVLTGPVIMTLCVCGGYALLIFSILGPSITEARDIAQQQMSKQNETLVVPAESPQETPTPDQPSK